MKPETQTLWAIVFSGGHINHGWNGSCHRDCHRTDEYRAV